MEDPWNEGGFSHLAPLSSAYDMYNLTVNWGTHREAVLSWSHLKFYLASTLSRPTENIVDWYIVIAPSVYYFGTYL